jgi:hypothetical protein
MERLNGLEPSTLSLGRTESQTLGRSLGGSLPGIVLPGAREANGVREPPFLLGV